MELRLDRLLAELREYPESILAAIDSDPFLIKRTSGDLVLANASQELYTPTAQHQLYAKGIVYRRNPYRLVSLPLVKIYNLGERDVTAVQLTALADEPGIRLRFLRKLDGSLIQAFRHDGQVWFTTRGMLEGARWRFDEQDEDRTPDFDYLGTARAMALSQCPQILDNPDIMEGKTLLFELIHPKSRKVTNYGDRADMTLLSVFDHSRFAYLGYEEMQALASRHGIAFVDALSPGGADLGEQIDSLLASLAGTDEEGSVVTFETGGEVIYRVKIKSPEYLQLMRLMAFCTYDRTVEMIDADPTIQSWDALKAALQNQGRDRVPEEVLLFYREHWDRFQAYLADLARLRAWAEAAREEIDAAIGGRASKEPGEYRRAFAREATKRAHSGLIFSALDGKLDTSRLRKSVRTPAEAREMIRALGL